MDLMNKSELIACDLEEKIRTGVYLDKLPSEQQVASQYSTTRVTAARALNLLVERSLAFRVPFKGTFVKKEEPREIRVMGNDHFFRCLSDYVPRRFPGLSLLQVQEVDQADLLIMTTFVPFEYEKSLLPFPSSLLERIEQSGEYYPLASKLHTSGGNCYGVPALFSPFLLAYDRKIMERLDTSFDPYRLTLEKLQALKKKALAMDIALFDPRYSPESLFSSILSNLVELPLAKEDFLRAFELFEALIESANQQRFLFRMITRHGAALLKRNGNDFDIAPVPLINGKRHCSLASEAIFVSRNADKPGTLFEICEASIMPEFQRLLTAGHYAIPIHRGCALDSLGCTSYRDDFFFAEIKNLSSLREQLPFSVKREIRFAFRGGRLSASDKDNILQALEYSANERRRNQAMLKCAHHYSTSIVVGEPRFSNCTLKP
jgi:hypothetical protein